jgi:hydroxylaminobenzene mutase
MSAEGTDRRLIWHGVMLFLLGLVAGAFVPLYASPRLGLSAHVGGVTTGTFLTVVGLIWDRLRLSAAAGRWAFRLVLYGTYGSSLGLLLAAIFGTSRSTPIAGAGHVGAPWQEALVDVTLTTSALAVLMACLLLLRGLGRARASG